MPFLTKAEICAHLRKRVIQASPSTIQRWIRHRRMPHLRIGRRPLFDAAQVDAWVVREFGRNLEATAKNE